jgi:D-alanine-D-alanine ligase-like ATP-grasp enzyme
MASEEERVEMQRKIRVAVVFGGRGPEHAVSCLGAGNTLRALDRDRYEVIPIGITSDGTWVPVPDEPARLALSAAGELPTVETVAGAGGAAGPGAAGEAGEAGTWDSGTEETGTWEAGIEETGTWEAGIQESGTWQTGTGELPVPPADPPGQVPELLRGVDVVLPILHGPFGEDGTMQGLLEIAGIRYAGAGVLASAVGIDKEYMKIIFAARGLPVGRHVVVRERDWVLPAGPDGASAGGLQAGELGTGELGTGELGTGEAAVGESPPPERKRVLDAIAELGWPVFVKPARGGSSIGTSRASDMGELHESIALARRFDHKVIVEAAIDGTEIEVGVLEGAPGQPPDTSLPGQMLIDGADEFHTFGIKYLDPVDRMAIPARIPAAAIDEIRRLAAEAFDAVSCEGLARVDFFYTTDGRVVLNEINTLPGLTPTSYFQKLWEASGLPFGQLLDRVLQTALAKRPGLR